MAVTIIVAMAVAQAFIVRCNLCAPLEIHEVGDLKGCRSPNRILVRSNRIAIIDRTLIGDFYCKRSRPRRGPLAEFTIVIVCV